MSSEAEAVSEHSGEIGELISELGSLVQQQVPHLRGLYDVFAAEAVFGREWLAPRLVRLPAGARVLEVGAGAMLLSCQLAREGYRVVALEPIGSGFSDLNALQSIVRSYADARRMGLTVLPVPVEDLQEDARYDLAFSVNVMEHVADVARALRNVTRALKPHAAYVFTCPNYRFPYEPHFGFPILGSKAFTGWVFRRAIHGSRRMADPIGVWQSLNWISVGQIRRICAGLTGIDLQFDRSFVARSIYRVTRDAQFASRRTAWMRATARLLVATGMHRLAAWVPARLQPVIDCAVVRRA